MKHNYHCSHFMAILLFFCCFSASLIAQTTVFSENLGTPSATTTLITYSSGTAPATFENKGTLTFSNGGAQLPADIRNTSPSSSYSGASGGGNVFFTSTAGSYGFSVESINASPFSTLVLQFGYRKESLSAFSNFSVEFWDGTSWNVIANTAPDLFNEAVGAGTGWYLSKALPLPSSAQINGLKIRFVKSGSNSIRIDDIKLTGVESGTPAVSSNANLTSLTLNAGTLSPAFTTGTTSYTASVGNAVSSLTVTPTKDHAAASIKVNGTTVISGTASGSIALVEGSNTITTVVTAEDTTTKAYTVTVTRAASVVTVLATVAAGVNAAEPATSGTFNISLSAPAPASGTTIAYLLSGSATKDTDYTDPQAGSITIAAGSSSGTVTLNVIDDSIYEGTETIMLTLDSATNGVVLGTTKSASINLTDNEIARVVINEVYGGGGNSGAPYKNDFIELYNNEDFAVNLTGWSVQYASATGTTSWQKTDLTGSIPAKGYYLIQQGAGTATGTFESLPTPDATGSIGMSGTAGKVALVSNTSALSGQCPESSSIIDLVGYGDTANCFETARTAAPANATSVQRTPKGKDTNDNSVDFTVGEPTPFNSVPDVTAPVVSTLTPANNATAVSSSFTANIEFNEKVVKGTGTIVIKRLSDDATIQTIDVASTAVIVAGKNLSFDINTLSFNTAYYVEISAGAVKDPSDNEFAGITVNTTWGFTVGDRIYGTLGTTYNFNSCISGLPDGFTQFSVTGAQKWSCTTFGRDSYGVQMNGYATINNLNEDWFISPAYNLTGTDFPLLSFWSRTAFTGDNLVLKVSTDYSGTGNPADATWTELNGKFPGTASDIWTISDNINLSAYKNAAVYLAIVYKSTAEDGARWTLDDFTISNSSTPPPPSLTVSAADMLFPYAASGTNKIEKLTIIGNDLVEDMTVTSTGAFMLSKNGTDFSTSLTYTAGEDSDTPQTVFVRFAPSQNNLNFTGSVNVSTSSLSTIINLAGTSIDPITTLEVVNWNVEWFGSTTLGPTNKALQEANVTTILKNLNADIYGLMEIVDESKLASVVSQMPGYEYVISNYSSHTNTSRNPVSALADAQKLAFVYKTAVIKNNGTRAMLSLGINTSTDAASTNYSDWSSGRYPFMMDADVTLNCETKNVKFILVHAKANTAPVLTSYDRRKRGADVLRDTLNTHFSKDNIIIFGDFNDDLDATITAGRLTPESSWSSFLDNPDYSPLTLPLSLAGKKSTVSYKDIIDHVIVSNEMNEHYMAGSARSLTDVSNLVAKYGTTTSDHYPIFTRYTQRNTVAPTVETCTADFTTCETDDNKYTIPVLFTATDDCNDKISYNYIVTGDTERNGSSNDASGTFNVGTNTITWTATDDWGNSTTCSTVVKITPKPTVGAASSSQTVSINTSLTNITHTTYLATGIGASTGLPAGVHATFASNTITISGTPTESGVFNYSIPLTSDCESVNATGTITVNQGKSKDPKDPKNNSAYPIISVVAFPNPAIDYVTVSIKTDGPRNVTLKMYDIHGTPVNAPSFSEENSTDTSVKINVSQFKRGVYVYTLSVDNRVLYTDKIVKK